MSLQTLVSVADGAPGCGTVPRRWPPRGPHFLPGSIPEPSGPRFTMHGPHPEPWRLAEVRGAMFSAIRIYQLGQLIGGHTGQMTLSAAEEYFDDWCGTVPLWVLIHDLLHPPPPPPEPWLDTLIYLGNTVAFAQRSDQEQLAAAASQQLAASLKAVARPA